MSKSKTVYLGARANFWERNRMSGGYLLKKTVGRACISIARALLLFGLCFMIIQPLLTRFSKGIMEPGQLPHRV